MPMQANQQRPTGARTTDTRSADPQAKAQQMTAQAHEKAQEAAGQVQDRLRQQVDQRSSQAAEQINTQVSDLRTVSGSLREQGKEGPAKAADRLADYAEKIGVYLQERDSDALFSDAEDLARRQPWAVATGGLALGFAASRFLKASSQRRYAARSTGQPTGHTAEPPRVPGEPLTTPQPADPPIAPASSSGSGSARAGKPHPGSEPIDGSTSFDGPTLPTAPIPETDPWRT